MRATATRATTTTTTTTASANARVAARASARGTEPTRVERRIALLGALGAATTLGRARANANAASETKTVTIEAVPNERWVAVDATVRVPDTWTNRPGQRAKRTAYVLYTDTYGPNNRYTTALPKYLSEGATKLEAAQLVVVSREGLESMEDFGEQDKIDPARAFGIELGGLVAADTLKSSARSGKDGQKYYQWELSDGQSFVYLLSSCVSGGGLYAFVMQVDAATFDADATEYRTILESLDVPRVEESRNDMSSRIYENR